MQKPGDGRLLHQNTAVSSVYADERLELSVVVQDLQLDPGSNRALVLQGSPAGLFSGATPPAIRSQGPKSSKHTRVSMMMSMMDDPDDLLNTNRREELNKRSNWILPCLFAVVFILRLTGPHLSLTGANPQFASILSPGRSFYYMLIPIYVSNLALVIASFTPILRGTSIIRNGVTFLFPLVLFLEYVWQWLMTKSDNVSDALTLIIINFILSMTLLFNVYQRRQHDLHQLWLPHDRFARKLRDVWFVELPWTLQAAWTFFLCLVTAGYSTVAGLLKNGGATDLRVMAGRQMNAAVMSLTLLAVATTIGFVLGPKGVPAVAFMTMWAAFDFASSVRRVPDIVASPQLAWIDPKIDVPALRGTCNLIGILSCLAFVASLCLHAYACVGEWRGLSGHSATTKFPMFPFGDSDRPAGFHVPQASMGRNNVGTSVKRRPSEFLMRSDSSITEDETPSIKRKPDENPITITTTSIGNP